MKAEIYWVDAPGPGRLAILPRPRGGDWLDDDVQSLREEGVDVLVSLLEPHEVEEFELQGEAAACATQGIDFVSHPIRDHTAPPRFHETAALVRSLEARMSSGKGVAVHCFAGVGRSGTLAAAILLERGLPLDTVLERLALARGYPVPETAEQHDWLERFARARGAP
jgi:protein-tyrosine phosphatase